ASDWSSDVCSSDLGEAECVLEVLEAQGAAKCFRALALPGPVEFSLQLRRLLLVHRRRALLARLAVMRCQLRVRHESPPPGGHSLPTFGVLAHYLNATHVIGGPFRPATSGRS